MTVDRLALAAAVVAPAAVAAALVPLRDHIAHTNVALVLVVVVVAIAVTGRRVAAAVAAVSAAFWYEFFFTVPVQLAPHRQRRRRPDRRAVAGRGPGRGPARVVGPSPARRSPPGPPGHRAHPLRGRVGRSGRVGGALHPGGLARAARSAGAARLPLQPAASPTSTCRRSVTTPRCGGASWGGAPRRSACPVRA